MQGKSEEEEGQVGGPESRAATAILGADLAGRPVVAILDAPPLPPAATSQDTANTLWGLAKLELMPETPLLDSLVEHALRQLQADPGNSQQDTATVASCMARFSWSYAYHPPREAWMQVGGGWAGATAMHHHGRVGWASRMRCQRDEMDDISQPLLAHPTPDIR